VKHCGSIPQDVRDYFRHELDRTAENRRARQWQSLLREEVVAEGNVVHDIDSDNDEELQCAIHVSREEVQYAWWVREQGGRYEHGVGRLNNNQVVVSLTDWRGRLLRKGKISPFKLGLTPTYWHQRVSKPNPQLVRNGPSFFTPKPSPVRKLTIRTSLWHARKHKDGVS
jgi:flavin-dependent dehydrogenase